MNVFFSFISSISTEKVDYFIFLLMNMRFLCGFFNLTMALSLGFTSTNNISFNKHADWFIKRQIPNTNKTHNNSLYLILFVVWQRWRWQWHMALIDKHSGFEFQDWWLTIKCCRPSFIIIFPKKKKTIHVWMIWFNIFIKCDVLKV